MSNDKKHPDLLAYVEGRLDSVEAEQVREHLPHCRSCREEVKELESTLGVIDSVAKKLLYTFPQKNQREKEADLCLGPDAWGDDALELSPEEIIPELPPALAQRLPRKKQESVADRLRKSIETLTGKGKDAAQALAERIMTGGMEPGAAPAIRQDATKEEDEAENASGSNESSNPEIKKDDC